MSMANSGCNTNGSQFFLLFKEAKHLDLKHSVFGRVVGGLANLDKMEEVIYNNYSCCDALCYFLCCYSVLLRN